MKENVFLASKNEGNMKAEACEGERQRKEIGGAKL